MTNASRCTNRAPSALCGELRPLPRCSLMLPPGGGPHTGDCRASTTVFGVGKAIFKWKATRVVRSAPPKPVSFPSRDRALEKALRRTACRCPLWKQGHLHVAPCTLLN